MNKKIILWILIVLVVIIFSGLCYLVCSQGAYLKNKEKIAQEQAEKEKKEIEQAEKEIFRKPKKGEQIAVMHVKNYGKIKMRFFKDVAPKAVENFIGLSKKGYYNGVTFHRVINEFMIQGGDPTGTGAGGQSFFKEDFEPEYKTGYVPYRGTLCMASKPKIAKSLSSQFFIVQAHYSDKMGKILKEKLHEDIFNIYKKRGGYPSLYNQHTVFGYVYEGMDVVDKIAKTKVNAQSKPTKNVVIEKIEITEVK